MKSEGNKKIILVKCLVGLAVILQTLLVFYLQHRFAFLLEDTDYMVNLKTGSQLNGLGDIFAGIPSVLGGHGGSVLSIGILQLTLLLGETFSDVLNTFFMLVIAFLISRVARTRKNDIVFWALPFFMMVSLNSDWQYSYMWQFGIVNFVYPAIPFLAFLIVVVRELNRGKKDVMPGGLALFACVEAFLAGWANASYGIVVAFISIVSLALITKMIRRRAPMWLRISTVSGLLGAVLYFAATGNFKEGAIMNGVYISFSIFPGVVLGLLLIAIILRSGSYLTVDQMVLIAALGFSVLMRFMIGWLPGVAENGIQICCLILSITLVCSLLVTLKKEYPKQRGWIYCLSLCAFLYAIFNMLETFGGVG